MADEFASKSSMSSAEAAAVSINRESREGEKNGKEERMRA